MQLAHAFAVAAISAAAALTLSNVTTNLGSQADVQLPLENRSAVAQSHDPVAALEAIHRRLEALERPRPRRLATAGAVEGRDARLAATLETLQREVNRLAALADSPSTAGETGLEDEPPTFDDSQGEDDLELAFELTIDNYEDLLASEPPAPALGASIEDGIVELAGEQMLAGTQFLATHCSAQHCRLEFSHDDQDARDEMAANVALLLPSGTISVTVPVDRGGDVEGTIVYLTLADG